MEHTLIWTTDKELKSSVQGQNVVCSGQCIIVECTIVWGGSASQNTHIRAYKPQLLVSLRFNKINNLN